MITVKPILNFSSVSGRTCLSKRGEVPKVMVRTSMFYIGLPLLGSFRPRHASAATCVGRVAANIFKVFGVGDGAQVTDTIVARVTIYVVYFLGRPNSKGYQPGHPMSVVRALINTYLHVTPYMGTSFFSRVSSIPCRVGLPTFEIFERSGTPKHQPGFWAVMKQAVGITEGKVRHSNLHQGLSSRNESGGPSDEFGIREQPLAAML